MSLEIEIIAYFAVKSTKTNNLECSLVGYLMSTRFLKTKQQGKSRELISMVDFLAMFITPHNN